MIDVHLSQTKPEGPAMLVWVGHARVGRTLLSDAFDFVFDLAFDFDLFDFVRDLAFDLDIGMVLTC